MLVKTRSAIPGRVRWDVPLLVDRPNWAATATKLLSKRAGVRSVAINAITGSVLVHYSPELSLTELQEALVQAVTTAKSGVPSAEQDNRSKPTTGSITPQRVVHSAKAKAKAANETPGNSLYALLVQTERHRKLTINALTAGFVDRLFEAAPPLMIAAGIDVVTRGPGSFLGRFGLQSTSSQLIGLGALSSVVWTADSVSGYRRSISYADLANNVRYDLRNQIYQHIQSLDVGIVEGSSTNEWLGLLRDDVDRVAEFIETGIDPFISIITNIAIVGTTFVMFSPLLAAIQLLSIPALYWVSSQMLGQIVERERAVRQEAGRLTTILSDNVTGIATITSYGTQPIEAERVAATGQLVMEKAHRRDTLKAAYVPAIQMAVGGGFISTLVYGAYLMSRGTIPPSVFTVMGNSSLKLLASLGYIGSSLERYYRTKLSLDRINNLLQRQPVVRSGNDPIDPKDVIGDIRFTNVRFAYNAEQYHADQLVIRDLTMQLAPGKMIGIVGLSGAGKSTLLKLLLRFYDAQSGSIQLDGKDLRDYRLEDLHRCMAIVPQQMFLFSGTIRDNIAYGKPTVSQAEVERAAKAAAAQEFIERLPLGYDTRIGEGGHQLSGGERQRIVIARAVLANPPIFLFDEATSAIDYKTEAAIQQSLRTVTAGRTTIIVAHRISTIRNADCIYVLMDGQIREHGDHETLVLKNGIYASMWRVQTGEAPPLSATDGPDAQEQSAPANPP